MHFVSTNWFGAFFRTCNGQNTSGSGGTGGITFRIDNCKGGTGYSWSGGSPSDSGASGTRSPHNVETYGISGVSLGTVTSNDRTGGCGVLFNFSSSCNTSTVNSTRCCWGCGYAGFRTANTNATTTIGAVNATSCGRGYFSVSNSRTCTVNGIQTYTTSGHGIWLQTTYNTRVSSGTVRSGSPCTTISAGSGNSISVSCQ